MDIEAGERAEKSLDVFIEHRGNHRRATEGERLEEELWVASARIHAAKQRRERAAAWHSWHVSQAGRLRRTLEALIAHHQAEAEKLLENGHAGEESA